MPPASTRGSDTAVPQCMAKKWLPVAHRNGTAIYYHQNVSADEQDCIGGELMVSSIVKGTAQQCLSALVQSRTSNSILGPAQFVAVQDEQQAASNSQVLLLQLTPPSTVNLSWITRLACSLIAPRYAVVHVALQQDPRGITCLMFHSLPQQQAQQLLHEHWQQADEQQMPQQAKRVLQQVAQAPLQHQQHRRGEQDGQQQNGSATHANGSSELEQPLAAEGKSSSNHQQTCNGRRCSDGGMLDDGVAKHHSSSSNSTGKSRHSLKRRAQSCPSFDHAVANTLQVIQHNQQQLEERIVPGRVQQQQQAQEVQSLQQCPRPLHQQQQLRLQQHHHMNGTTSPCQQLHQQRLQQPGHGCKPLVGLRYCWQWLATCLVSIVSFMGWLLTGGCTISSCNYSLSSSSSTSSTVSCTWRPVLVHVAGGFTISALEGIGHTSNDSTEGHDDLSIECTAETLVTSILKVDFQGWLSAQSCGSLLHRAALWSGVVDVAAQQLLSAVERVKSEVEQSEEKQRPPQQHQAEAAAGQDVPQKGLARSSTLPGTVLAVVQALATNLTSLASIMLASLAAWRQQRQHTWAAGATVAPAAGTVVATSDAAKPGGRSSSGGIGNVIRLSSSGAIAPAAPAVGEGVADLAAAPTDAAAAAAGDLVGLDESGLPLSGYCNKAFWSPLHELGHPALFKVRGPSYLQDHVKVAAGRSAYTLTAVDLVTTPTAVHHLARYLPSVRRSRAASSFVVNMMVPTASDVMNLVMTFSSHNSWPQPRDSSSGGGSSTGSGSNGGCGRSSIDNNHDASTQSSTGGAASGGDEDGSSGSSRGSGFDHALLRFLRSSDEERSHMFKMIPHIEVGPWLLQQTVGTTPVIMGHKLATTYHLTERYMEVDIDVTTCKTAGFIVQSIRGMTTSLVVDLCYLLEAQKPCELPEVLIGAVRFSNLDMSATTPLNLDQEVPCWPQPWQHAVTDDGSTGACTA